MRALLAAFMNPPPDEAAFNAWYDEEHVPLRLAVPGFLNGRRYRAHDAAEQLAKYLALYDLESLEVLQTRAYIRLNEERSKRERDMLAQIPMISRRVLTLELDGERWTDDPPYQLTVAMTPPTGAEDDFVAWYREEHIRMLLNVPGWKRVRLFRQVEGDGPAFMAVHELESPQVFETTEYEASISTPWRKRIRSSVLCYERNLFALWRA
jgi:hypothetical protein